MSQITVRTEAAEDAAQIRNVNIEAFRDHPVSRQTEHLIVDALRAAGALEVSLVAVCDHGVVGHSAFSRAGVGDSDGGWFLVGPVAVLPSMQRRGIGSALVEAGLSELRTRGAKGCVLVGDAGYYSRFGFSTFSHLEYDGVPNEYVLGLPFGSDAPAGRIQSHDAFEVEPD